MSQVSRIVFVIVFVPKKFKRSSKEVPKTFQRSSKKSFKKFLKSSNFLGRSCLLITLIKCLKGHKSLGLLLKGVLWGRQVGGQVGRWVSMQVGKYFFGQVMSPHHSDNISQWSQVSQSALWQCFSKVSCSQLVSE